VFRPLPVEAGGQGVVGGRKQVNGDGEPGLTGEIMHPGSHARARKYRVRQVWWRWCGIV
jgi:hypothetical protein